MYSRETPVLFVIFNRPEKTKHSFEAIRAAQPKKLFIAADGPRETSPTDAENCKKTRAVVDTIDWDCEVKTLFRDKNSGGSGQGVSSAIHWFFDHVEAGIILEDDCVPNLSFFFFCEEMLKKYQDDQRVMHICGSNFLFGKTIGDGSYYYSRVINVWGWATWKRAWQHFDYDMKIFPKFVEYNTINHLYASKTIQKEYLRTFQNAYDNTWKCWDRRWMLAVYANNGVSVVPNYNLVANIGYGEGASAEYYEDDISINMPTAELNEIVHPSFFIIDREADEHYHLKIFTHPPLPKRIKRKLKKIVEHGK
uniref:Nucleotide-diphospho-sugar transferase n=1 Tax=Roseihalotalea indica TaxID=2867963 RepID=A0AA49JJZ5_9BACT|nr:nucleotide-diphospho-sugar transferase [Tunicatimonas sp. TK19036]